MPMVVVDGVENVPKAEVPVLTDQRLQAALEELTSIQYFREKNKVIAQAWNVLNHLAPELAKLAEKDPQAAYYRIHGTPEP